MCAGGRWPRTHSQGRASIPQTSNQPTAPGVLDAFRLGTGGGAGRTGPGGRFHGTPSNAGDHPGAGDRQRHWRERLAAVARTTGTGITDENEICRSVGAQPRTWRGKRASPASACRRRLCRAIASSSPRRSGRAFGVRATIHGSRKARLQRSRVSARLPRQRAPQPTIARSSSSKPSIAPTAGGCGSTGSRPRDRFRAFTTSTTSPARVRSPTAQMRLRLVRHGADLAVDMTGKLVWERRLGREVAPFDIDWGRSSSPHASIADTLILLLRSHAARPTSVAVEQGDGQGALEGRSRAEDADAVHARSSSSRRQRARADRATQAVPASTPTIPLGRERRLSGHVRRVEAGFPSRRPPSTTACIYMTRGYRSGPYIGRSKSRRPRFDVSASHVAWDRADRRALRLVARATTRASSTWRATIGAV